MGARFAALRTSRRDLSVPASTVTSLTELAQAVLATAEDCLATTAAGIPERSFITPAPAAWDCCPFLTILVSRLGEETTSPFSPPAALGHRVQFGRINLVTFVVTVVRCAPDSIDADEIEIVAAQVQEDGWSLWCGFYDAIRDGRFRDQCSVVHFDFGRAINQQGGCVGWEFVFRAELGGIPD